MCVLFDHAAVDLLHPVEPRKSILVVLITLLGFGLACAYVLIVRAIHRGLEDPSEVEAIGMPVYATIPQSDKLPKNIKSKADKEKTNGFVIFWRWITRQISRLKRCVV